MSDHYYSNYYLHESDNENNNIDDPEIDPQECLTTMEKSGDELLIELYRERPFLYNKSNSNFKNRLMKENAWNEISAIMIEHCKDKMYISTYCQKRCTSLRDQYVKEKRKIDGESKSGSASKPRSKFNFFAQMSFLDNCIKRRSTYSNCPLSAINNDDCNASYLNNNDKRSNTSNNNNSINSANLNQEHTAPMLKKRKLNETKELEQTIIQLTQRISNFMEKDSSTVNDAFFDFLKAQFDNVPETEKDIRRKMLMDALTSSLSEKYMQ